MDLTSLPHISSGAPVEEALDLAEPGIVAVDLPAASVALVSHDFLASLPRQVGVVDALAARAGDRDGPVTVIESVVDRVTPDLVDQYGAVVVGRFRLAPPVPLRLVCPNDLTDCTCGGTCPRGA